jgi:HEAT repeat protein
VTMTHTYTEPVSKLLELGRPENDWQVYAILGITHEDIPELLRLVQDSELRYLEPPEDLPEGEDLPAWYAQIHAWRALGQLKAEEAIPTLLGILHQIDYEDDDWLSSDVHLVFGMIGPAAIEPLKKYLADEDSPMYARTAASSSLAEIGIRHPEEREQCIEGLTAVLEKYETNDEGLNGFLIGDLVDMKAVETIELIKKAFEADAVDEMVNGDVEDVQIEMGLLEKRLTPERPLRMSAFAPNPEFDELITPAPKAGKAVKKEKNKRKQEKKSRKKNRKRK